MVDEVAYEDLKELVQLIWGPILDIDTVIGKSERLHEQTFYNVESVTDKLWKAHNLLEEALDEVQEMVDDMDEMREYDDDEEDY